MTKIVWFVHEPRSREVIPYILKLRQYGYDIQPKFLPVFSEIQHDVEDFEKLILIFQHSEDLSYGEGSWNWSTQDEVKLLEHLHITPFVKDHIDVILLHQSQHIAVDDAILNLGVAVETSYENVIQRILNVYPICVDHSASSFCDSKIKHFPIVQRLVFVRHAQRIDEVFPEWGDKALRPQDTPITEGGISQSQYLGRWLSSRSWVNDISSVLCSPFVRTVQTAHYATNNDELRHHLISVEYGLAEGADWMATNSKCQTPWHLHAADLMCVTPRINLEYESVKTPLFDYGPTYPGRPTEKELWYDRCAQTVWRIALRAQKTVVLVTHAGCIGLLVHALSGRALPMIGHTAVTSLIWDADLCQYVVEREADEGEEVFASQTHLPLDLRTGGAIPKHHQESRDAT
jgi:broad specificity phosphatase PhoE